MKLKMHLSLTNMEYFLWVALGVMVMIRLAQIVPNYQDQNPTLG